MDRWACVDLAALPLQLLLRTHPDWAEHPAAQLTPMQHEQLRTQPDLIRDFALHLAAQHRAQGREVAVYADAWAALNGRPAQRLLRPELDLTRPLPELEAEHWIVPLKP